MSNKSSKNGAAPRKEPIRDALNAILVGRGEKAAVSAEGTDALARRLAAKLALPVRHTDSLEVLTAALLVKLDAI